MNSTSKSFILSWMLSILLLKNLTMVQIAVYEDLGIFIIMKPNFNSQFEQKILSQLV